MRVSAVIPAFNAERRLARAVNSLLDTGYQDLEILIVDDGSTDRTRSVAEQLVVQHPSQIRLLTHPDGGNRGVSASRNLGMAKATGELLCFLDADDFVFHHRFESSVPILEHHPHVDGVYELTSVCVDGGTEDGLAITCQAGGVVGLAKPYEGDGLLRSLFGGYPWLTGAFIFRKTLLQRTGMFNVRLKIAEDCNLWFRMAAIGMIVPGNMNEPVCAYVRHGANTYNLSIDRKLDMVAAMLDALKWIADHAHPRVTALCVECISIYVVNAIVQAREARKLSLAWNLVLSCASTLNPRLLARSSFLRQLPWLVRESYSQSCHHHRSQANSLGWTRK